MKYNVGIEFSPDPAGRFYTDGDASGEQFREEVLLDKLKKININEKLIIVLDDGIESYGSSFLSEAFGGLVKYGYFRPNFLLDTLRFEYSDPEFKFFEDRIKKYITDSSYASKEYVTTKEPSSDS
ncbi:DUF4325 domain-containing protein [Pseudidiomarina aestuarii]|uniref:DUF4325 domain-containing protein n=1 Tax=Pseudidiomarina aestuarii TaxID=624146 RepID=A0A2T4D3T8_9GAMM|nr:DUF4325 domain-containing protein [Pseudidiomarina aestuarii]PTB88469.1 DUF4325 domain-containing protein [Pseudidiomarina aestuarii]PTB89854.1 DUF4325 domain-containing protein [Pseudidiomarina aestuarii]